MLQREVVRILGIRCIEIHMGKRIMNIAMNVLATFISSFAYGRKKGRTNETNLR